MILPQRARALALLLALPAAPAAAQEAPSFVVPASDMVRVPRESRLDSKQLERQLQGLDWEQFRSVIEAIPKLRADVDAYGPAGWEFVKGRYRSHDWSRNIDKLDRVERERLAALIETAVRRPRHRRQQRRHPGGSVPAQRPEAPESRRIARPMT